MSPRFATRAFLLQAVLDSLGADQLPSHPPLTLRVHHPDGVAEVVSLLWRGQGGCEIVKTISSSTTFGARLLQCDLEDKLKSHPQIQVRRWSDVTEYQMSPELLFAPPDQDIDVDPSTGLVNARFGAADELARVPPSHHRDSCPDVFPVPHPSGADR